LAQESEVVEQGAQAKVVRPTMTVSTFNRRFLLAVSTLVLCLSGASVAHAVSFGGITENVNNDNPLSISVTLSDVSELGNDILNNETDWKLQFSGDTTEYSSVCVPIVDTQFNETLSLPLSSNAYTVNVVGCSNPNNFGFTLANNVFVQSEGTINASIYTNTTTTPSCGINSTHYKIFTNNLGDYLTKTCGQSFSLNNTFLADSDFRIRFSDVDFNDYSEQSFSLIERIDGCTDSQASNYDPLATHDDGSCTYPEPEQGFTFTVEIAPNGFNDVRIIGGTNVSMWGLKNGQSFGAISYTGNSFVWDNFQPIDENLPNGSYCFGDGDVLSTQNCIYGSFNYNNGVISNYQPEQTASTTPYVVINPTTGVVTCPVPPYDQRSFTNYRITQPTGQIFTYSTSGTGICTGSFVASTKITGNLASSTYSNPWGNTWTTGQFKVDFISNASSTYVSFNATCTSNSICTLSNVVGSTPNLSSDTTYRSRITELFVSDLVNGVAQSNLAIINAQWVLNQSEIIRTVSERNPTAVSFSLTKRPSATSSSLGIAITNTATSGSSTASFTGLTDGTYDILVKFSNSGCAIGLSACPFPLSYMYSEFQIIGGDLVYSTTSNEIYNNLTPPSSVSQYEDCGITNISGCISNSFRFLFIPSGESLDNVLDLRSTLETTIPFSYALDIPTVIDNLTNTVQNQSATIELDLGFGMLTLFSIEMVEDFEYSNEIRTLLSYMLWLLFAFAMYRIGLNMFSHHKTDI